MLLLCDRALKFTPPEIMNLFLRFECWMYFVRLRLIDFFYFFFAFFVLPAYVYVCAHHFMAVSIYKYVNTCICSLYSYDNTNHKMKKERRSENGKQCMLLFTQKTLCVCVCYVHAKHSPIQFTLNWMLLNWMLSKLCYSCSNENCWRTERRNPFSTLPTIDVSLMHVRCTPLCCSHSIC